MKKLLTAVLLLTVMLSLSAFGQKTKWSFVKTFPDPTSMNYQIHGLAVDGAGKLWIQPYGIVPGDSVFDVARGANRGTRAIYIYNGDGSLVRKLQLMQGAGVNDTLYNPGLGLRRGPTGDIYLCTTGIFYKVNYLTGAVIGKVIANAGNSLCAVGVDSLDEVFVSSVGESFPLKIYDGTTFAFLGNAIDTVTAFGRSTNVSKDGNELYHTRFTANSLHYHCDLGTIGPYVVADTILSGLRIESSAWNPRDKLIYLSSGSLGGGYPAIGYTNQAWFAYDPVTKTIMDSLIWDGTEAPGDCRPRAIDFSLSGDTAWVGQFGTGGVKSVQMFVRTLVGVEPVDNFIPSGYTLTQNYPNPFNPTTEIQFSIAKGGFTTLKVYDMLGKEVATLVNEHLNPGTFKSTVDGSKLASGTYLYRLVSGTQVITKKMMLLK
jgi:hypothetical protein